MDIKKKGFTLVELLAILVIISILVGIVIAAVDIYQKKAKGKYYESLENQVELSAKDYYSENSTSLPMGQLINGENVYYSVLSISELTNNNFLSNIITDFNGEECSDSYVIVENISNKYKYHVCLICGENKVQVNEEECNEEYYKIPQCQLKQESYESQRLIKLTTNNADFTVTNDGSLVYNNELKGYLANKNGTYNFTVTNTNGKTNSCKIEVTGLDNSAPEITTFYVGGSSNPIYATSTLSSVYIAFSDEDVESYCISTTNDSSSCQWLPTTTSLTTSYNLTQGDGTKILYAFIKDNNKNISASVSDYIILDTTSPTLIITKNGGKNEATINTTISDNIGVTGYSVTTSTSNPSSWTSIEQIKTTTMSVRKTSAETFYIHAKDSAGNTAYKSVTLAFSANSACSCQSYNSCSISACGCRTYASCANDSCSCRTYNSCRDSSCGCATYNSCRDSSCGCATYYTCETSACGAATCTIQKTCTKTYGSSGVCDRNCSGSCEAESAGKVICTYDCSSTVTSASSCGYKSCATSACGCRTYASCANDSCSCRTYDSCVNDSCSCRTYNSCRDSSCGCSIYKTCTNLSCGCKTYNSCWLS